MRKLIIAYKELSAAVKSHNNEQGFIMGLVIILCLMLILIVTMAMWSSNNESHSVRSTGIMTQEFYDAESGIVGAINNQKEWLTTAFISTSPDRAYVKLSVHADGSVIVYEGFPTPSSSSTTTSPQVAEVQIRHIDSYDSVTNKPKPVEKADGTPVDLWPETNLYPDMPNIGPSKNNSSGTSQFYAITAKDSNNENSVVQVGLERLIFH